MARTTLVHPVPLPTIRGMFLGARIIISRLTQVRYTPDTNTAEYDAMIESIDGLPTSQDDWTPKETTFYIEAALYATVRCEYVVWRRDHWIAHLSSWSLPWHDETQHDHHDPEVGSDAWIAAQEGIE